MLRPLNESIWRPSTDVCMPGRENARQDGRHSTEEDETATVRTGEGPERRSGNRLRCPAPRMGRGARYAGEGREQHSRSLLLRLQVHSQLVADLVRRPLPVPAERGLGDPQPRLNPLRIDLEMKLHPPRGAAETEGLIGHVIAGRQQFRAGGEIEGILVPLEDAITALERAQHAVALSHSGEAYGLETELADRRSVDPGIEGTGQHLRAQTDTQHR